MIWCVQFELAKWRQPNKIMVNRRRESNRKKSVWFCNVCNFVLHGIRTASCVGSPYSFFNTFNLRCHYQPQVTWKCRHKSKRHSTGTILDSQLVFQVTGLVSITSHVLGYLTVCSDDDSIPWQCRSPTTTPTKKTQGQNWPSSLQSCTAIAVSWSINEKL